jgi:hypothetical protein
LGRPGARPAADADSATPSLTAPILKVDALNQYYGGSHILATSRSRPRAAR